MFESREAFEKALGTTLPETVTVKNRVYVGREPAEKESLRSTGVLVATLRGGFRVEPGVLHYVEGATRQTYLDQEQSKDFCYGKEVECGAGTGLNVVRNEYGDVIGLADVKGGVASPVVDVGIYVRRKR
jgi:hypothetical protein